MTRSVIAPVTTALTALLVTWLALPASLHADPGAPATTARPGMEIVRGVVVSSQARWSARRIVTDSVIRTSDGRTVTVSQMGGTIDGIGMVQFPGQPVLARNDVAEVEIPRLAEKVAGSSAAGARPTALPILRVVSLSRASDHQSASKSALPEELEFVRTTNTTGGPLFWESNCVFLSYDCDGTSHIANKDEFAILDGVFQNWRNVTQSCSYLDFRIDPSECAEVGNDGKNVIKFREKTCDCSPAPDAWCRPAIGDEPQLCYTPDAAALTTLHFVNDPDSPRNGMIVDADIEINGVNFAISANGTSMGPAGLCLSDLANTLTHEAGHLMGLDHTCRAGGEADRVDQNGTPVPSCFPETALSPQIREATMYNFQDCGETKKSSPETDDVNAICSIYPASNNPGECKRASLGKNGGGCRVSTETSSGPSVLLVLACALLLIQRRRVR